MKPLQIALLTGAADQPYAFGLTKALASSGLSLDVIAGDELDCDELRADPAVNFLNLRGNQDSNVGSFAKIRRVLVYYRRLLTYALSARPKIFHVLWNNKFETFDRTVLMLYYKALGKRIVLTVHNVNAGRRDSSDSTWNRYTLRCQYLLADHIFVHTDKMKHEMVSAFRIPQSKVTVIPFGINNAAPHTSLTPDEAKARLGLDSGEKTILFFGNIAPYKGLEYLVEAFAQLSSAHSDFRLLIVGRPRNGSEQYWEGIRERLGSMDTSRITQRIEFVPDAETELYFKAADVLVLPYTEIFQSGVLILGYSFGLPTIVADVGSLRDDVREGQTGFVCKPWDSIDLARALRQYFASDLYRELGVRRAAIRQYALEHHSWEAVGTMTNAVYAGLIDPERRSVACDGNQSHSLRKTPS
jgi:glycosyltransferase involved in cell wall biosynthesis